MPSKPKALNSKLQYCWQGSSSGRILPSKHETLCSNPSARKKKSPILLSPPKKNAKRIHRMKENICKPVKRSESRNAKNS
jgi:hypothetical protein